VEMKIMYTASSKSKNNNKRKKLVFVTWLHKWMTWQIMGF
jgi:hypothetical protein